MDWGLSELQSDLRMNMMMMMMMVTEMMMACTDTSIQINVGSFVKNSKLHLNAFQRSKKICVECFLGPAEFMILLFWNVIWISKEAGL